MQPIKLFLSAAASFGLLFLTACGSGGEAASTASSPAPSTAVSVAAAPSEPAGHDAAPQAGGQVVESGAYHLEFVPETEATGTHLDFYLKKGDAHAAVPDAKVTAQVQLPDGTQKSLDLKYDAKDKHYTGLLAGKTKGDYKVAILSEVGSEKVNGRFSFSQ
jgi:pyruvate/2-oxoglutarate dehydrogenase complex dihydrolipoamide acyltransferase (E2) component